jgi:hypothetical protein
MSKCPVCDHPLDDVQTLLELIDSPDLLVTLALDFAEHVARLSPYPSETRARLGLSREWKANPEMAYFADAAWADYVASERAARAAAEAEKAAERAAIEAIDHQGPGVVVKATQAAAGWAIASVEAGQEVAERERVWQRTHIEALACTCEPPLEAGAQDRSRISSLAS